MQIVWTVSIDTAVKHPNEALCPARSPSIISLSCALTMKGQNAINNMMASHLSITIVMSSVLEQSQKPASAQHAGSDNAGFLSKFRKFDAGVAVDDVE